MDTRLAIYLEVVTNFGVYDKAKDDVDLTLCPKACGGPVMGHLYDQNNECLRKSNPNHADLTKAESHKLIDDIKSLPSWNKAKLLWMTNTEICTCDMCHKVCPTLFHLHDHLRDEHRSLDSFIADKVDLRKFKRPASPSTIEEAVKTLLQTQGLLFNKMNNKEDNKQSFHVQKPEFVPEWTKFQKYEVFRENLSNWDQEHTSLSDSNKFGKVMTSLTKNKDISDLSKLTSGKISESLTSITDKTVTKILEMLDDKYKQTKSEKYEVLSHELQNFRLNQEDDAEASWEKFCTMRSSLRKENVISDLFLHVMFFNACTKSQKIKRNEEHYFRDIIENETDTTAHKAFKDLFSKQKIIGKRAATKISTQIADEKVLLCEDNEEEKIEDVRYGEQQRGRQQFRGKKRFFRSNSKPGYYKFESCDRYQGGRDQSTGGGRFRESQSKPGMFRSRSQNQRDKSVERRISPLEQKVDELKKMSEDTKKVLDEIVKKLPKECRLVISEEINQIYLATETGEKHILIDCGCPKSMIGREQLERYLKSQGFTIESLETRISEVSKFKFGETVYDSLEIVKIPIKIEDSEKKMHTLLIDVHVIEGSVPFLFGKDTGTDWEAELKMKEERLNLRVTKDVIKSFPSPTIGSHYKIRLHDLKEWEIKETVHLVKEEMKIHLTQEEKNEALVSYNNVKKIHEVTNHKSADNLMWAFKCADLLDADLRKTVSRVINDCKICRKFKKTFSRPKSTLPKSTEFNQIVTMDLKFFGKTQILRLVDSCTRFLKGAVLPNKEAETIVKAVHESWICNFGFPSVRFWADNGKEFANVKLSELGHKAGFKVEYGPAHSPWSNGTNERNHASADLIVKRVLEEDRKISLPTAVAMAGWTHNTNINYLGYSPLQLVTGKSIVIPGVTFETPSSAGNFDADIVRSIITNHCSMLKNYTSAEFRKKLMEVSDMRRAAYNEIRYSPGDKVYYQDHEDKAWYGPVKVVSHDSNFVFVLDRNILKKLNIKRCMPYEERKEYSGDKNREKVLDGVDIPDGGLEVETPAAGEDETIEEPVDPIAGRTRSKSISFSPEENIIEYSNDDLRNDTVGAYYACLTENEDMSENSVYRITIPTKQHGRPDVVKAKEIEMENLRSHETWSEVPYQGQELVNTKWVITEGEKQDGQKQKVKGRLLCKGYEESLKPQSDSPTIGRSNLIVYTAVAANQKFHLWAIDIKGAYLQSNKLDRDIFIRPPPDIRKAEGEDIVWKLNKPMYGLDDSGRKFYLKVKEILTGLEFDEMYEDNAFFYLNKNGNLLAMISSHVDDFKIAANEKFGLEIIENIKKELTVSKVEKDKFRFTGVDFKRTPDSIVMSMEDYAASLTKIDHFREAPKEEGLSKVEHKLFRKKVGQLSWLASNVRPDLSYPVQSLSQKSAKPTMEDLKKINHVIGLAKSQENKVVFRHIDTKENLQILGVSDASWSIKTRPV